MIAVSQTAAASDRQELPDAVGIKAANGQRATAPNNLHHWVGYVSIGYR